jgi:hypothetical protein
VGSTDTGIHRQASATLAGFPAQMSAYSGLLHLEILTSIDTTRTWRALNAIGSFYNHMPEVNIYVFAHLSAFVFALDLKKLECLCSYSDIHLDNNLFQLSYSYHGSSESLKICSKIF